MTVVHALPPGYAAYLRVYEPLNAFPEPARSHWTAYTRAGRAPDRVVAAAMERQAAVVAVLTGTVVPAAPEHALVTRVDGLAYVCPWSLRARAWAALEDFCAELPVEITDSFVPATAVAAAGRDAAAFAAGHPEHRLHMQSSGWQVPVRWFTLFAPDERRLVVGRRAAPAGRTASPQLARELVYLTAMSRARRRLARALATLRRTVEAGPGVQGVEQLGRWLEEFHPHSLVELDYGGLVHLLDDVALREDTSVADVAAAIGHLSAGQGSEAAAAYERVTERWRPVAALESAN